MALNITILEVSGNVVVTASGSINLSGLTFVALTGGGSAFVNPSAAVIVSSAVGFDMDSYGGNSTISNLGSGGFTSASSYSGNDFGIAGAGNEIYVRQGYVSNTPINGTITFNGTNFTTMGFTQGTYTSSWASDSVTIQVGLPPSPTPTNTQTPTVTPTNTPTPTSTPQPNSIEITSVNYVGQIADITYTPCSGGTISLGSHVIPYTFQSFNYTGQYSLYFSAFNSTCSYEITCPTPTPTISETATSTPTPTPSVTQTQSPSVSPSSTPTNTPTPSGGGNLEVYLFIDTDAVIPRNALVTYMETQPNVGTFRGFNIGSLSTSQVQFNDQINAYVKYSGWGPSEPSIVVADVSSTSGGVDSFGNSIIAYTFQTVEVLDTVVPSGTFAWYTWIVPTDATNNQKYSTIKQGTAAGSMTEKTMNSIYYNLTFEYSGGTNIPNGTYRVYTTKTDTTFRIDNAGQDLYFQGGTLIP